MSQTCQNLTYPLCEKFPFRALVGAFVPVGIHFGSAVAIAVQGGLDPILEALDCKWMSICPAVRFPLQGVGTPVDVHQGIRPKWKGLNRKFDKESDSQLCPTKRPCGYRLRKKNKKRGC